MDTKISRRNGYGENAYTYYPVVIIGGGESGIAMGCQLKAKLGFDQFRIFERQSGIGGTWYINNYPGVSVDVPAIFYSFSFAQNPLWSKFFPPGEEILRYLHDVCAKFGITDKIQLDTDVESCKWNEDEELWELGLRHMVPGVGDLSVKDREDLESREGVAAVLVSREIIKAKVVISGIGGLHEPKTFPDHEISGRKQFEGKMFHSARWDYSVDMNDKDVVVLGTGCSAAQFVPKLTEAPYNARSVTQLMRSPPYLLPRSEGFGGDKRWSKYAPRVFSIWPPAMWAFRIGIFFIMEYGFLLFGNSQWAATKRQEYRNYCLDNMKVRAPEKYHSILTPDYDVGCKRRVYDATWLPSLNDPKLELTTQPLKSINQNSVTIGPGFLYPKGELAKTYDGPTEERTIPADVIISANGFDIKWGHPLKVYGRNNVELLEQMESRGGPQAYMGMAMDNFPNYFLIIGPNVTTGHSSVILHTENMVKYVCKLLRPMLKGSVSLVEVKKEAEINYTADIQAALKKTVFTNGCTSWYFTNGWNHTMYPYSQIVYTWKCMFPIWSDWNIVYTKGGAYERFFKMAFWAMTLVVLALAVWAGFDLRDAKGMLRFLFVGSVTRIVKTLEWVLSVV